MKKIFLFYFAIGALFASCSNDETIETLDAPKVVSFTIETPELLANTRAAAADRTTADGALKNVDFDNFDLRYQLAIIDGTGKVVKTYLKVVSVPGPAIINVTFDQAATYKLAFWADIISEDSVTDLHYNTSALFTEGSTDHSIKMIAGTYLGNIEEKDAFTAIESIAVSATGTNQKSVKLVRPLGKMRVVASDANNVTLDGTETTKISYTTNLPDTYDVVTGVTSGTLTAPSYTGALYGGIDNTNEKTLAWDYIFAPATGQTGHGLKIDVERGGSSILTGGEKITPTFPIERNKLTTMRAAFFSGIGGTIEIDVNDEFITQAELLVNGKNGGYIDFGVHPKFSNFGVDGAQQFTVEFWTKITDMSGFVFLLSTLSETNDGEGNLSRSGWNINVHSGNLRPTFILGGVELLEPSHPFSTLNQWVHMALVTNEAGVDGENDGAGNPIITKMYVNGVEVLRSINIHPGKTLTPAAANIPLYAFIGASADGTPQTDKGMNGYMKHMHIWNTAKSAADINAIKDNPSSVTGSEVDLVCGWAFDTTVADNNNIIDITGQYSAKVVGDFTWQVLP